MTRMKSLATAAACMIAAGTWMGCAAHAPQELVDARQAYQEAKQGPASQLAPSYLHTAEQALHHAEDAFEDEGNEQEVRDLAYIALRRAQLAKAQAGIEMAEQRRRDAEQQFSLAQAQQARQTQEELTQTREQLLAAERARATEAAEIARSQTELQMTREQLETTRTQQEQEMARQQAELARQQQELQTERQARLEAEQRAEQAMRELQSIAQVREEERGTVITLPGGVLFASAQWALLPASRERLDRVADVLKGRGKQSILIEGHTDSQGSESYNYDLSMKRATAVRDYLVGRGIESNRVRALGLGEGQPVADNSSPEGRAMNRRVEIIIERERAAMR